MENRAHESTSQGAVNARRDQPLRIHAPQLVTLMVAFVFVALGWVGDVSFGFWAQLGLAPTQWWHLLPLALMVFPMVVRVRYPALAMGLGLGIVALDFTLGFNVGMLLCLTDLIYGFALRMPRRTVLIATLVLAAFPVAALCLALTSIMPAENAVSLAMLLFAVLILPIWWAAEVRRGLPLWQDSDTHEKLQAERHAAVLRAQAAKRRAAIEAERRDMARELHDVVSSQVSAIAITSGAVLNAAPDTERDRKALESVRRSSLEALDQLSDMVRLLRGDAADESASADGGSEEAVSRESGNVGYTELVESLTWQNVLDRAQEHGVAVDADGHPPHDLSAAQHHVLLRVLQESLTNALKYGDGTAEVVLRSMREHIRLRITSPISKNPNETSLGAGTGIVAMRERVELVGGTLYAGVDNERGDTWLVEAALPHGQNSNRQDSNLDAADHDDRPSDYQPADHQPSDNQTVHLGKSTPE